MGMYLDEPGYLTFSEPANKDQNLTVSFPVSDFTGDGAADLLQQKLTYDEEGIYSTEITVLNGSNGTESWRLPLTNSFAYAYPAGDMNGDGINDLVVNVVMASQFIPYSGVSALSGPDGDEIWSSVTFLGATLSYPLEDLNEDGVADVMVHEFFPEGNDSVTTQISTLRGTDGEKNDIRTFAGCLALDYPVGNLTGDGVSDHVIAVYDAKTEDSLEYGASGSVEGLSTQIIAVDWAGMSELWSLAFGGPVVALPVADLTGDGLDDLLLYELIPASYGVCSKIVAVRGQDGTRLWEKAYESLAIAIPVLDLTGDGAIDLLIYELGPGGGVGGENRITAVDGQCGTELWEGGALVLPWTLWQ